MDCRMNRSPCFRGVTILQVSSLKSRLCSKMLLWSCVARLSLLSRISSDITRHQVKLLSCCFGPSLICVTWAHMPCQERFTSHLSVYSNWIVIIPLSESSPAPLLRTMKMSQGAVSQPPFRWLVVVDHFFWLYFWGALMTTATTTTLPCSTTIQGVIGSSAMVVIYFLWYNFVCSYFVVLRENFKAKAWESICSRHYHLDELSTRIHELFVPTPRLSPIGGMYIEFKCTLQVQQWLCVNEKS
jgi:hypothetical protein